MPQVLRLFLVSLLGFALAGRADAGEPGDLPTEELTDLQRLELGNTAFALDLYGRLKSREGNLFFSPYSISSALAMTWAGARGATAAEMGKVLHFELGPEKTHPAMGALMKELGGRKVKGRWGGDPNAGRDAFELVTANALWIHEAYPFRKDYFDLVASHYDAELTKLDILGDREGARKRINGWVEGKTRDKIRELLLPGHLSGYCVLVLTNAVYFKAPWIEPFRERLTKERPFTLAGGDRADVPMMHRSFGAKFLEEETFRMVEIPYLGRELSMLVLVPKAVDGLAGLEARLTPGRLAAWISKLQHTQVALGLPKFRMECRFGLNDVLKAMGMASAFDPKAADFSGMSDTKELYIGTVTHKAFVDVNEAGTEAAAATAVVMKGRGMPPRPVTLDVDRPFLFLIRDGRTGSVLFLGRVADPRGN